MTHLLTVHGQQLAIIATRTFTNMKLWDLRYPATDNSIYEMHIFAHDSDAAKKLFEIYLKSFGCAEVQDINIQCYNCPLLVTDGAIEVKYSSMAIVGTAVEVNNLNNMKG